MFIAVLFTVAKVWKQPKCPSANKWIMKMWYTPWHNTQKQKEQKFAICNKMDGLIIKLSEISQREKDKHYMILLYMKDKYFMMWNLKK